MTKGSGLLAGYPNHYDTDPRKNKYSRDRREETKRQKEVRVLSDFFPLTFPSDELVCVLETESKHVEGAN